MARRPFYGQGGAIPIARMNMQAATAPGRAYAQMGKDFGDKIGGAIKQYGLNKEKQKVADARIKSAVNGMPEFVAAGVLSPEQKTMAEEFLSDPSKSSMEKVAFIDEQEKRLFQLPKLQLMQNQGRITKLEADFQEADKENRSLRSTLETEGVGLLNRLRDKQLAVAGIEKQLKENELGVNKERLKTELEQEKASLKSLQEEVIAKRNTNSVFADLHQKDLTKYALDVAKATSALAVNAEELNQLKASSGVNLETKNENLSILQAERKKLEQELSRQQQLMNAFSTSESSEKIDFLLPIDIDNAFQKDAAGLFYNIVGGIGGLFGADITPETTSQAQNLRMLETVLLPALTSDISSRPSNFTLEIARGKIPLPNDRDDIGQRKIEQLIPDLKLRLKEAESTIKSGKTNTNYFQEAVNQASRIRSIIPVLENSLKAKNDDQNSSMTGKTSTNIGFKIIK